MLDTIVESGTRSAEMAESYDIVLSDEERSLLAGLPEVPLTGVQTALIALEAKATPPR